MLFWTKLRSFHGSQPCLIVRLRWLRSGPMLTVLALGADPTAAEQIRFQARGRSVEHGSIHHTLGWLVTKIQVDATTLATVLTEVNVSVRSDEYPIDANFGCVTWSLPTHLFFGALLEGRLASPSRMSWRRRACRQRNVRQHDVILCTYGLVPTNVDAWPSVAELCRQFYIRNS